MPSTRRLHSANPSPRALEAAGGRSVHLLEQGEDAMLIARRNPDALVGDAQTPYGGLRRVLLGVQGQADSA